MIELFNNYAKQFDLTVPEIIGKYHHSFRVAEFAKNIAISLALTEDDIELAYNCGLLHDIARFKQYSKYHTYIDEKSFDHGDVGYDILNELLDDDNKDIILKATKYHNKYKIDNVDERTKLFCNIVRDADKLDIIKEQGQFINDKKIIIKDILLNDIYNNKICENKNVTNSTDDVIRMISWINDFNYNYSLQYLIDNNILENKFNLLNIYGELDEVKKLKDYVYKEINNKLGGNYGK